MKLPKKSIYAAFIISSLFFVLPKITKAQGLLNQNGYNQNRIIEDSFLLNYDSMSLSQIQSFLASKNSFLANYTTTNAYGEVKTAAQIIYDASRNNYDCDNADLSDNPTELERQQKCKKITTINPKFLLVLLQKEQSLIENVNPSQKALDEATGYGCNTGYSCNPYWKGFGKQINSAALQFLAYMQDPAKYTFKIGGTYIAKDRYAMLKTPAQAIRDGSYNSIVASNDFVNVTIENQATAALYNYTPHVYNGNYNTHMLIEKYFGTGVTSVPTIKIKREFPNGSVIKAENDPRIWLIQNGQKKHFANWSAFASRFRLEQVITATAEEVASYAEGPEIKFANYSLVQIPDGTIYLIVDDKKRAFDSLATFKKIGFNPEELDTATKEDLSSYGDGKIITSASKYITGVLMQDSSNGEVYYVEDGTKALVDKSVLETKYIGQNPIKKTSKELATFKTIDPVLLNEGTLVRTSSHPTVYLISDGKKRPFTDENTLINLGYNKDNVITASSQFLYNYEMGEMIK